MKTYGDLNLKALRIEEGLDFATWRRMGCEQTKNWVRMYRNSYKVEIGKLSISLFFGWHRLLRII